MITGRDAPQQLLEAADLVTEMTKVKHPMDVGPKGPAGHRVVSFRTVISASDRKMRSVNGVSAYDGRSRLE